MKRGLLYFCCLILLSSCFFRKSEFKREKSKKFNQVFKSTDNEYRYKMAEQFYATKKYSYALQLFEDLFPYVKGTDRYEDLYYKAAYCYYYTKDYLNAENFFKSFVETFPSSKRAEECDYMRAYCYYKQSPKVELDQTATTKAMVLMQSYLNTHPGSPRSKEANAIIDLCREKIEAKEFKSAELYYNLGFYRASAIAFNSVSENFPDSKKADEYKLLIIKSYYNFAEQSIETKQEERFTKVLTECTDFIERFNDSKLIEQVLKYKTQALNNIKKLKDNEQIKKAN
ncbi:MAG: outer membrane protein assembly factor BamD [Chitinophagaceae bacterium]